MVKPSQQQQSITRGCVFGATHDATFEFWIDDKPKWKRCLAFGLTPPSDDEDAHYFIGTSNVNRFTEQPLLMTDCLIFEAGSYPFFPEKTAIDFSELCIVPMEMLRKKGLKTLGHMSATDIERCAKVIAEARILPNKHKKLLGLANS